MWNGKNINYTENRPVLHYLLREKTILEKLESYLKFYERQESVIVDTNLPNPVHVINIGGQVSVKDINNEILGHEESLRVAAKSPNKNSKQNEKDALMNESELNKLKLFNETLKKEKTEILEELIKIHDFCEDFTLCVQSRSSVASSISSANSVILKNHCLRFFFVIIGSSAPSCRQHLPAITCSSASTVLH